MDAINSLTEIEKQCILRFLYEIAQTDYKVVEEEICTINRIVSVNLTTPPARRSSGQGLQKISLQS